MALKVSTSPAMSSADRSTSSAAPRSSFSFESASSKRCPSTPSTTSPYIWIRRRYESLAKRGLPGALGEPAHGVVVQAEVEDRVHHPGHRDRRARAHGDEERVVRIAEALAGLLLERGQVALDLGLEAVRELAAALRVRAAGVGRDREAGRNGHAELGHLREPDALAAEQVATSLGGLVEVVDEAVRGHALRIFPQVPRLKATPCATSGRPARRERATLAKRG